MQAIIDYLLNKLENDEDVEEIYIGDVHSFLESLIGNEMNPAQMIADIGLYELDLTRVAHEGYTTSNLLRRLMIAPAMPKQGYVVGL